jgi:DNA-binding GntR family transcriptional regulator
VTESVQPIPPTTSLRTKVETALSAAIIAGEMPPGELFSAPALAARFNVSATPVREAMLNLEKRGFVEAVRNKGFRVTAVSEADLADIVGVRLLLEPPAMRQLAGGYPADRAGELRAMAERIVTDADAGDLAGYLRADTEFHLALTALLGNRRLVDVVADLRAQTRLVGLVGLLGTEALHASSVEHLELLAALERRDSDAAEQLMHRHIEHVLGWWAGRDEPSG